MLMLLVLVQHTISSIRRHYREMKEEEVRAAGLAVYLFESSQSIDRRRRRKKEKENNWAAHISLNR